MSSIITQVLESCAISLDKLRKSPETLTQLEKAGELLALQFQIGAKVFSCGNGGSMCDAMHFAEELSGRFRKNRPALPAMAISDPAHMSCTSNDFGYDFVFSRFIEGFGKEGDILFAISTSGKSPNCINAAKAAKEKGMKVITLTGKPDSELGKLADIDVCTQADGPWADRVQELHIKCIHILIQLCEKHIFGMDY